jgi:two-component system, NtrC family, sensor histidine kinase HupT/HoxJ
MSKRRMSGTAAEFKRKPRGTSGKKRVRREPADIEPRVGPASAMGEHAWIEVVRKMDEVYRELLNYEVALEQNNAALQESQLFISSVLSSMSDVLIVCDPAGTVEEINASLLKLTGKRENELRGGSILGLFADGPSRATINALLVAQTAAQDAAPAAAQDAAPAAAQDAAPAAAQTAAQPAQRAAGAAPGHAAELLADCELSMQTAGGQAVPVALSCTPRFTSDGRRVGLVVTGRPVGDLRKAYSALRQAHDDLQRTQQQLLHSEKMASLGRLVAGVAHELNNPISFVLGNVVALKKYLARLGQYLDAVEHLQLPQTVSTLRAQLGIERLLSDLPSLIDGTIEGAERTRNVVEGLRRFSAPRADARQRIDLVPVLERAVLWVSKAAPDRFQVTMELPESLPIVGNADQLQQVVMNLVQNAADAIPANTPGRLKITGRREDDRAILEFTDSGAGIEPDNLPKLFDPFFTTKPVGKGMGLGLAISYGIVERHGGTLTAANAAGGGAVFTLSLPAREGARR